MAEESATVSGRFTLKNKHGIHVRTSAQIAECCESFNAVVTISTELGSSDGTDMMRLMMLQAGQGTELHIRAEGDEAMQALQALEALILKGFDSAEE